MSLHVVPRCLPLSPSAAAPRAAGQTTVGDPSPALHRDRRQFQIRRHAGGKDMCLLSLLACWCLCFACPVALLLPAAAPRCCLRGTRWGKGRSQGRGRGEGRWAGEQVPCACLRSSLWGGVACAWRAVSFCVIYRLSAVSGRRAEEQSRGQAAWGRLGARCHRRTHDSKKNRRRTRRSGRGGIRWAVKSVVSCAFALLPLLGLGCDSAGCADQAMDWLACRHGQRPLG
jgi:hypothetical protein